MEYSRSLGLTGTRSTFQTLKYILNLLYPKPDPDAFIVYLIIKYIVKLDNANRQLQHQLHTLPDELYSQIVKSLLPDSSLNDSGHCLFVPESLFDELYSENFYYRDGPSLWITIKLVCKENEENLNSHIKNIKKFISIESPHQLLNRQSSSVKIKDIFRTVQILPVKGVTSPLIFVNETEYFNIENHFRAQNRLDSMKFQFAPIMNARDAPKIAQKVVIQMVNASLPVGTDLTDVVLSNYFKKPKFLHRGDFFCIPLVGKYMANMYQKYSNVAHECCKLYFKCINVELKEESNSGFFVMKGRTDLIQDQNINSFLPKRINLIRNRDADVNNYRDIRDHIMPNCPYGYERLTKDVDASMRPFLFDGSMNPLNNSVKCTLQPIFLIRAPIGAGVDDLLRGLSERNGLNFFSSSCRQLMASTSKQSESKIDALLQKAKNVAPATVLLEDFEMFGLDVEKNEESRIVDSFKTQLTNLFENFTKYPIIIFACCLDTFELKSGLARIFLETFSVESLKKEQRKLHLQWFMEYKNMAICDENGSCFSRESNNNIILREQKRQNIIRKGKSSLNKKITAKNSKNYENDLNQIVPVSIDKNLISDENTIKVLDNVAAKTETFTFKDLDILTNITLKSAYLKENKASIGYVKEIDFYNAIEKMRSVQSHRMNVTKVPNVKWEEIGGLQELKREIFKTIELPLKYPQLMMNSNLRRSGLLLWGPPGCGKTLVARAIASQLQASFLSVKGPELLDMYVGQSEKNMRDMFANARASAPCVIFLDEAEAAAGARGASGDSAGAADRLVSQLLAELDGVASRQSEADSGPVIVVAATNRPDLVEPALLRPGRLDKLLYVGPYEGETDKVRVLEASSRNFNLLPCVDLKHIANKLPHKCTGADLTSIVNKARKVALARAVQRAESGELNASELNEKHVLIDKDDFENAVQSFIPSLSIGELNYYESLRSKLS